MMSETRTVTNGNVQLQYNLCYKKVKRVNIRIQEDGSINVSANPLLLPEDVDKIILKDFDKIYTLSLQHNYANDSHLESAVQSNTLGQSGGVQSVVSSCSVLYHGHEIKYKLNYKAKKNIIIRMDNEGNVIVSAPPSTEMSTIYGIVLKYAEDILAKQNEIPNRPVKPCIRPTDVVQRTYMDGETYKWLGQNLTLRLKQAMFMKIEQTDSEIILETPVLEARRTNGAYIENWLHEQRIEVCQKILPDIFLKFQPYNIPIPRIIFKCVKSYWGCCLSGKAQIVLHERLFEFPTETVKAVLIHEFCHFVHPNHSPAFYALMTSMMPDWKEHTDKLDLLSI